MDVLQVSKGSEHYDLTFMVEEAPTRLRQARELREKGWTVKTVLEGEPAIGHKEDGQIVVAYDDDSGEAIWEDE